MTNIALIYFSGTGNTKLIAENIKNQIEKNKMKVDLMNIENDKIDCSRYEKVIIGGPVYVERYPEILLSYAENNLKGFKGQCMIFTTQAVDNGTAAFQHAVNRLNFLNITYSEYFRMPNNAFNFFFGKTPEEEVDNIIKNSLKKSARAADEFIIGMKKEYPKKILFVTMINLTYKFFYRFCINHFIKKVKVHDDKCIKCGLCEKRCPSHTLKLNKHVKLSSKCIMCQRCMSNCPKEAFYYKNNKIIQYKLEFKGYSDYYNNIN